jgi:hypothetical protein
MSERRSPRTLRDVSHLFLSGGASERHEPRRGSVCVWIAVAGPAMNRAHFAAGTAAAFARQGMGVSLLELCDGLPNIGYYFGMEPAAYLAPARDRSAVVTGVWNGSIRYCASANSASFEQRCAEPIPSVGAQALLAAFPCPRERDAEHAIAMMAGATAGFNTGSLSSDRKPDAVIAAGCGESIGRAWAFSAGARKAFPNAAIVLITDDPDSCRRSEVDEKIVVPRDLRSSWARRMPPMEPFFGDLAYGILLMVGQQRRRGMHGAASA